MKIADSVLDLIGDTPLVRLRRIPKAGGAAVVAKLEAAYGGLRGLVRNERGEVHRHIAIYVNSEAIDALSGLGTRLKDGDEVAIIPALAGGRC